MDNPVLKTSADELYELVKLRKKISIEDVAKLLKIPDKTTQALVDFLVEEKVFGIEYKFTTPYIYLSQEKGGEINLQARPEKNLITKDKFFQKASKWSISAEKVNDLWKKYVQENFSYIKEEFYKKAHLRNLSEERIEELWKKYWGSLQ